MVNKDLKVLLVSPLPPPVGGIATWTESYINWCKNKNIEIVVINTSVIGKRDKQINFRRNFIDETKRTIKILKKLRKTIKEESIDVVHLNSSCGTYGIIRDFLCAKIIKRSGKLLLTHYHCDIEEQIRNRKLQKRYLKKLALESNINLVLNKASCDYLLKETTQKSTIVTNFIDKDFILDKKDNINNEIKKIVYIGHVQKTKGAVEIITVAKAFPTIQFVLAGPISNEIKKMNLSDNIITLGAIKHNTVKELLCTADVFLFPTYSEGFSIALLEAMAMGIPIITTAVGANEDMIESKGGVIVRKIDPKDIITTIKELQDKNIRKKMSEWNINKVKDCYTIDKVMNELVDIYLDMNT